VEGPGARNGGFLILALALAVFALGSGAEATASESARFRCPEPLLASAQARVETVSRAARRLVPFEYRRLSAMGEPAWPGFQIRGVLSLTEPGGRLYHRLARRLCGQDAAERSWAVSLAFPRCLLSCSRDVALVARTSHGWQIWYSAHRRP
jgi:hypothetical protein